MKISVSVPAGDLQFVDDYAQKHSTSRSAAIHAAIEALRRIDLAAEYEQAFTEWEDSGEAAVWDVTVGDGLE